MILCDPVVPRYVAVHGLKLEIRNLGEMKRVYELDVYKLAEALPDMVRHDCDKGNKIECVYQQYKSMKAEFPISIF